jgi:hypothetical protein
MIQVTSLLRFLFIGALTLGLTLPWAAAEWIDSEGISQPHTPPELNYPHRAPHDALVRSIGGHHLELAFDNRKGLITIYVLNKRELAAHPISAEPLTVRVQPVDSCGLTDSFEVKLQPITQDSDPPRFASKFVGSDIELRGLQRYVALVEASFHGETHHVIVPVDTSQVSAPCAGR